MRMHARQRRTLGVIERALETSQPDLAGMFAVFAHLTGEEEATGIERIPRRGHRRPPAALALLALAMVTLLVSGVLLGTSARGAATTCPARLYGLGYITSGAMTGSGTMTGPGDGCVAADQAGGEVQCQPRISGTKPQSC